MSKVCFFKNRMDEVVEVEAKADGKGYFFLRLTSFHFL